MKSLPSARASWWNVLRYWDSLCAVCERGIVWLWRRSVWATRRRRTPVQPKVEQLEPIVVPSNTPPVAVPDQYAEVHDHSLVVIAPGVLGNDSDADGDPLTASIASLPAHGS